MKKMKIFKQGNRDSSIDKLELGKEFNIPAYALNILEKEEKI